MAVYLPRLLLPQKLDTIIKANGGNYYMKNCSITQIVQNLILQPAGGLQHTLY